MSAFDADTRRYLRRLLIPAALLIIAAAALCLFSARLTRSLIYARDASLVSALLEAGLSESAVAGVMDMPGATAEGLELLERLGRGASARTIVFSEARSVFFRSGLLAALVCIALIALAAAVTLDYLRRRERLYSDSRAVLERFLDGDFSSRLPRGESGGLYAMLAQADALAMTLESRSESERRSKEALRDLISDISHQLKTPLAALRLYNDLTAAATDDAASVKGFAEKSAVSLERIEELVQTLLKVMRLDTGNVRFYKEPCRVSDLASRAVEELMTRAEREGKSITVSGDGSEQLVCDAQWTAEALKNLVKNALDYTGAGGHIALSWSRTPGMLSISVSDDGSGIPDDELPFIFKRFYRSAASRDISGCGLGLPLSRAVIEGQGGLLSVKSAVGLGSEFTAVFLTES